MADITSLRSAALTVSCRLMLQIAVGAMTFTVAGQVGAQTFGYSQDSVRTATPSNLSREQTTNEQDALLPEQLKRTIVAYSTREAPGTIVIDTGNTYLYYVLGQGRAIRYGVGVGREGFTWSGVHNISRKTEWPDWYPPADMIARQPYLPRFVAGGETNPLGARAMYLGASLYRIHGTNDPTTIGKFVSSGCIRMTNDDVIDLFDRVNIGTKVVVLPKSHKHPLDAYAAMSARDLPPPVIRQPSVRSSVDPGRY